MAAANGKKGYKIRFELSLAGVLGVGVVCFCIFLWMFLFGLWAGQTGLINGFSFSSPPAIPAVAKSAASRNKVVEAPELAPDPEPEPSQALIPKPTASAPLPEAAALPAAAPEAEVVPSEAAKIAPATAPFYAIQVGAFRDSRYVEEALQKWRALGYEAFSRPPSGANEHLTKVYLGHFAEASVARKEAADLAKKAKITPLIAMIPADPAKRP